MASDRSGGHMTDISGAYNNSGWESFYGIVCDNYSEIGFERYFWLGVYNFSGIEARPEIVSGEAKTQALLYKLYCEVLENGFSSAVLSSDEQEKLAEAVKNGLILKDGDTYKPKFTVFTSEQLAKLQNEIYAPLLELITPKLDELAKLFDKIHKSDYPKAKQGNIDHHKYLDLWMFGLFTLMTAAEDGKICLPKTPAGGTPLTLALIR
jgi:hypothetical protein